MFGALWDQVKNGFAPQPGWQYGNMLPMARDPQGALGFAVPQSLAEPIHSVINSSQKLSHGETPTVEDYMPSVMGFTGGGMATAGSRPNTMGVFGGQIGAQRLGREADLAKAMSLHSQGKTAEEIYQATGGFDPSGANGGFWRGNEGKWRFEMPDTESQLLKGTKWGPGDTLPDVISHPHAYQAYPEMTDTGISQSLGTAFGGAAVGKNPEGQFRVLTNTTDSDLHPGMISKKGEMLHEMQHIIQNIEGFSRGGTPTEFPQPPEDFKSFHEFLRGRRDAAWKDYQDHNNMLGPGKRLFYSDNPKWAPYQQAGNDATSVGEIMDTPVQLYKKLAGEAEARNVQARLHAQSPMGPPTRNQGYDWSKNASDHTDLQRPWIMDREPRDLLKLPQDAPLPTNEDTAALLYELPPHLQSLYEQFRSPQQLKTEPMFPDMKPPLGFSEHMPSWRPNQNRMTGSRPASEHAADMAALEEAVRKQVLDVQHPSPTVRKALQKKGK